VLVFTDNKFETREASYADIKSLRFYYVPEHPIRTLQYKLLRVSEGSLVELRLKNGQKATGVIEDYLAEFVVFRYRAVASVTLALRLSQNLYRGPEGQQTVAGGERFLRTPGRIGNSI
jgi:hypothetical protein